MYAIRDNQKTKANQVSSRTNSVRSDSNLVSFFIGDDMKKIELANNREVAIVDDEDFDELSKYTWYLDERKNTSYAKTFVCKDGKRVKTGMHRLIMKAKKGQDIDHRDRNGLNNRKYNLRLCTNQQNSMNRDTNYGTSKYKGVWWHKRDKRWYSGIQLNGKQIHLGSFKDETLAAEAYNIKANELFGEYARLNILSLTG